MCYFAFSEQRSIAAAATMEIPLIVYQYAFTASRSRALLRMNTRARMRAATNGSSTATTTYKDLEKHTIKLGKRLNNRYYTMIDDVPIV